MIRKLCNDDGNDEIGENTDADANADAETNEKSKKKRKKSKQGQIKTRKRFDLVMGEVNVENATRVLKVSKAKRAKACPYDIWF